MKFTKSDDYFFLEKEDKKTKLDILREKCWKGEYLPDLIFYRYMLDTNPFGRKLVCQEYHAIDKTKEGYWIDNCGSPKWISDQKRYTQTKAFCRDTKERALQDYVARTNKRIQHLTRQLSDCQNSLREADILQGKKVVEKTDRVFYSFTENHISDDL